MQPPTQYSTEKKHYLKNTYLHRLVLKRLLRVVHILQANAIKLSLVYVRDAVVLTPLRRTNRTLQVVLEAYASESAIGHGECDQRRRVAVGS